jgi:hypothetical protein
LPITHSDRSGDSMRLTPSHHSRGQLRFNDIGYHHP